MFLPSPGFFVASGPITFSPTSLSSLALWLDVSDGSTVTQSGGSASALADKSGLGRDFAVLGGTVPPGYSSTSMNGKPGLSFSGSGLVSATFSQPISYTWYFAFLPIAFATYDVIVESNFGSNVYIGGGISADTLALIQDNEFDIAPIAYTADGLNHLYKVEFSSATQICNTFFDETTSTSSGVSIPQGGLFPLYIGSNNNGTSNGHFVLGEAILCDALLSPTDDASVTSYLKAKWGTP